MSNEDELKCEYNRLLKRFNKASQYFDDESTPMETKEKHLPEFKKVSNRLSEILVELRNYTDDEATNGFKI